MARTIRIKLFKFDELSNEAKQKAIEWGRKININTDHNWHECLLEDFKEKDEFFDITNVYYSGFWSQGDGAMFEYDYINKDFIHSIIDGLKLPNWKKNIFKTKVSIVGKGKHRGRYYHEKCVSHNIEIEYDHYSRGHDNIEKLVDLYRDEIEEAIIDKYEELARELYRNLEEEYDYLNADEAIKETIIANEYEFTKDGTRY